MSRLGLRYIWVFLAGLTFGVLLIKGRIASWSRIQEMFWFESFHMYGVILSAIAVAMIGVYLVRRFDVRTLKGESIAIAAKTSDRGQVFGGLLFGAGWALTGACPGPMYALLGSEGLPAAIMLLSAIGGAWVYGALRQHLPH
jgi:hypothetical protein